MPKLVNFVESQLLLQIPAKKQTLLVNGTRKEICHV